MSTLVLFTFDLSSEFFNSEDTQLELVESESDEEIDDDTTLFLSVLDNRLFKQNQCGQESVNCFLEEGSFIQAHFTELPSPPPERR